MKAKQDTTKRMLILNTQTRELFYTVFENGKIRSSKVVAICTKLIDGLLDDAPTKAVSVGQVG